MMKKVLTVSLAIIITYVSKSQELVQKASLVNTNVGTNDNGLNIVTKNIDAVLVNKSVPRIDADTANATHTVDTLSTNKIASDHGDLVYWIKNFFLKKRNKNSIDTTIPHSAEPFGWGDFTWMNGNSRKTSPPLIDSKYFTGEIAFDFNSTYSFANPIDNTVIGTTYFARNNELQLSLAGFGGDLHYGNVRGRLFMQFGNRTTIVPRDDVSSYKGQYDLQTVYRYLAECYGGYHWDIWHGVNLDAGIFMSYIGLYSFSNFENWTYQASYVSDNTPWFFNGIRLQTFPTDRLKLEYWLVNGWQSYGTFNHSPGFGISMYYRPKEYVDFVSNNYYGHDDAGAPTRFRFHLDWSYQLRYFNNPKAKLIKKAAFSITQDFGGEQGDGVSTFGHKKGTYAQNFISGMIYNRLWIGDKFAWTSGVGYIHNPGQYLVLNPTGYADTLFQQQTGLGSTFDGWDGCTNFEYMVNQNMTLKIEYVHKKESSMHAAPGTSNLTHTNSPNLSGYFAGHGGITGPASGYGYQIGSGYAYTTSGGAVAPALATQFNKDGTPWAPDLKHNDNRISVTLLVTF